MDTGSKAMIRDMNTNFILKTIIEKENISRAEIAKLSGLTKATVSAIVKLLIDRCLVEETGSGSSEKGRKPIMLKFCPDSGYTLSFDIGLKTISLLAANLAGHTVRTVSCASPSSRDGLLPLLYEMTVEMIALLPASPYGVVGLCLGIHGIVHENRIIFTPYYPYAALDLVRPLTKRFNIPVYVENEANLSVIAEQCYCFDCDNIIDISIHSGIGLGIILNGRLYSGIHGYAGEFGHSTIELNGRPCPCGNRGCFEQYASEQALLKDFMRLKKMTAMPDISDFLESFLSGDSDAAAVMDAFTDYIAVGINNILNTLNPEIIVINSNFTAAFPELADTILKKLPERIRPLCHLRVSSLNSRSVLLGGACLSMKNFLGLETLRLGLC